MKDSRDSATTGAVARRKDGLTITELDGEVLVYDPEARRASCLNRFAAEVLSRCDGENSVDDIARDLPFDDVDERLVLLTLTDLKKARLLAEGAPVLPAELAGTSRRELLKRIGIGTAIAVPAVAGIPVPAVAQAATCLNVGTPCSTGAHGKDACCAGLQCKGNPFKTCQ